MPNSTCRLLSNGYKFNTQFDSALELTPCCLFTEPLRINLDDADFKNKIESYRMMLNGVDSQHDKRCYQCNFLNRKNLRRTWRDISFDIVPEDAELGDSSYLELQIDKTCNGGCIICGPWHSSFWQNEMKVVPIKNKSQVDPIEKILSIIDVQKVRKILFLGGEPFLSETDKKILSLIKQPELVNLQYTTNGSIYPSQDRIDLWKPFRSVLINFSIDGIGEKFNYIRYPLRWDKVRDNMINMRDHLPGNVKFKMNHVVNILNLYYHDEFTRWHSSDFCQDRFGNEINYTFTPAVGVELDPSNVTDKLYDLILSKYPTDSKVFKVIQNKTVDTDKILRFLGEIDDRRKLNWRDVFPEIGDCFQ